MQWWTRQCLSLVYLPPETRPTRPPPSQLFSMPFISLPTIIIQFPKVDMNTGPSFANGRTILRIISQIIEWCLYLAVCYMEQGCIRFVAKRQHVDKQFSESMWFLGFCTVHRAADLERFSHQCQNIDVNIKCSPAHFHQTHLLKISTCLKGNGNRNLVTNVVTLGFGIVIGSLLLPVKQLRWHFALASVTL